MSFRMFMLLARRYKSRAIVFYHTMDVLKYFENENFPTKYWSMRLKKTKTVQLFKQGALVVKERSQQELL